MITTSNSHPKSACQDKASFVSVQEARAAAIEAVWRWGRRKHQSLEPYLCGKCKLYHLATKYDDV